MLPPPLPAVVRGGFFADKASFLGEKHWGLPLSRPGRLEVHWGRRVGPFCHPGWIQDSVSFPSPAEGVPAGVPSLRTGFRERQSFGLRDSTAPRQGRNRKGAFNPRLLQSTVRSPQGFRRFPASTRSVDTQHVHLYHQVQDGDHHDGAVIGSPQRLDGVHRPKRRLLPDTGSSREPQVSSLYLERTTPTVSSPMFWSVYGSTGFHTDDGSDFSGFSQERDSTTSLPRRLASSRPVRTGGSHLDSDTFGALQATGSPNKLGKVKSPSFSGENFPRGGDSLYSFEGFSDKDSCRQSSEPSGLLPGDQATQGKAVVGTAGPYGFSLTTSSRRASQDEKSSVLPGQGLGQSGSGRDTTDSVGHGQLRGPSMVVRRDQPSSGAVPSPGFARLLPLHRRVFRGLGRLGASPVSERHVVYFGTGSTHQPARTEGDSSRASSLRRHVPGEDGGRLLRQHNCAGVPSQAGRDALFFSQYRGPDDPPVGGTEVSHACNTVCPGVCQCSCRLPQSRVAGHINRMDSAPRGVQFPLETQGASPHRPLCHQAQLQDPDFHFAIQGPHGDCGGCVPVQLGQSTPVRFSTICNSQESPQQTSKLPGYNTPSHRTILAAEGMVPRPPPDDQRHSPPPTTSTGPVTATTRTPLPPRSPRASTSRLESVKRLLRFKGYSRKVAQFLAGAKRHSTLMNYQYKWKRYRTWCRRNGYTVSNPSSQKFAEFLVHLRLDCHLSVSAIKGYKAMLNSVFRFKGFDLSSDPVLRDIISACCRQVPRPINRTPSWNLDVVLKALVRPPFEPIGQASIRHLTMKTLFLVALATARRVGELQACSFQIAVQGDDLILSYLPEFAAKTESVSNPVTREFRLRSLSTVVGREDEERLLCPVRALKWYRDRTTSQPRPRQLFLSVRKPSRPISKAAISFFLRETIKFAHASLPDECCPAIRVRAHDIRGIATSVLWWRNKPMSAILEAACWKTQSVFASYYLSDLQRSEGDIFALGPFVAAGEVVP